MIRVGVKNRGCSGLAYHLEFVEKAGKFDEVVEQDGVKVLIDSKALFSIIGSEMDWQEDKLSARFVFRNPNISECFPNQLRFDFVSNTSQRNNAAVASPSWSNDTHGVAFRAFQGVQAQCASSRLPYSSTTSNEANEAFATIIPTYFLQKTPGS